LRIVVKTDAFGALGRIDDINAFAGTDGFVWTFSLAG
jgi:hypothetical protein